jgi:HopA1 effector protein family
MNRYLDQVKSAVEATEFYSPTAYSFFGKEIARLPPRIKRAMTPRTARNYLLFQLQSQLYSDFYIRGAASPGVWGNGWSVNGAAAFGERLSVANMGDGNWEQGWEIQSVTLGEVVVKRAGLTLWVRPKDCLMPQGGSMEPGTRLRLRFPKESLGLSPGYYMARSNHGNNPNEAQRLVRLYWNLRVEGAETFVRAATSLLNEARMFFNLKVLNDPSSYTRCDAAVMYIRKEDYPAIVNLLGRIYPLIAPFLKPGTPVFTKPLAPGIGLAEDPGQAESFGQHRCRLLADGMIGAYEQGLRLLDQRLQIVTDRYAAEGISLSRPYLNPNSADIYTFEALR